MDPNMKDQSLDRRREEALARRLGEALDRITPRGTQPCPDAELIAAYHERSLAPGEIAECDAHFAACSRCRKILAVLAASDDTPLAETEVARLGELVATTRAPGEAAPQIIKPTRSSRWDWRARWLAPVLGVAAVLSVWFAVRPPWRTVDQGASGTLIAQAPKNEPLPNEALRALDQSTNVSPRKSPEADAASAPVSSKNRSVARAQSPSSDAESLAKNRAADSDTIAAPTPGAQVAGNAVRDEMKEQAELKTAPADAPVPVPPQAAAPPPMPAPRAQARIAGAASADKSVPGSTSQTVTVNGEAPLVNTTRGGLGSVENENKNGQLPLNGRKYEGLAVSNGTTANAVLIKTLSGSNLWRAGKGGNIDRSTDAGQTWRPQGSPLREDWLAGVAVSDKVCWLAGRNGALARTTDGEHWEQVAAPAVAPAASGKLPDWVAVASADAQTATITASDQRRYSTQDGGKTWRAQ
jgi:photosystem II stability/assembly factor-like uncharacterized protein